MLWWLLGSLGLTGGGIGIAALLGGGPFMLMAAKWLWSWLSHATFLQVVCAALALFGAVQTLRVATEQRHARKLESQLIKTVAAREADHRAYAKAQADAHVQNIVQVAAAEAQQKRISDAQVQTLNGRIARLSDELRAHGPAAQSHPDAAGLPQVPHAAGGADGPSGLCLSSDQLLRAAQDEERHNELIDWVTQQMTVDPSKL